MLKRNYLRLECEPVRLEQEGAFLSGSVINNSKIKSVGQEVGVNETFDEDSYVNLHWESGE